MSRLVFILCIAALFASFGAAAQQTGNPPAHAAPNVSMCIGCHGLAGYRTAYPVVYRVPKIAGQQEAYIVKALQSYRSGERKHPSMRGIAASLSDKDMAELAAYYAAEGK